MLWRVFSACLKAFGSQPAGVMSYALDEILFLEKDASNTAAESYTADPIFRPLLELASSQWSSEGAVVANDRSSRSAALFLLLWCSKRLVRSPHIFAGCIALLAWLLFFMLSFLLSILSSYSLLTSSLVCRSNVLAHHPRPRRHSPRTLYFIRRSLTCLLPRSDLCSCF